MVGKIFFKTREGEEFASTEYESWKKMKKELDNELVNGNLFAAVIYSDDEYIPEIKLKNGQTITYLQNIVPEDAEQDRFWLGSESITAMYFNPQGGLEGNGDFLQHTFPYDYILQCDEEAGEGADGDEAFMDMLYGDACRCPTYCIDVGTIAFDNALDDWENGIRPADTSPGGIRKWFVEMAKNHDKSFELAVNTRIYLPTKLGETKEAAYDRLTKLLESVGVTILDTDDIEIREI